MESVIYLKLIKNEEDIFAEDSKLPSLLKKIILKYKLIFKIATIVSTNNYNIMILPFRRIDENKIEKYLRKQIKNSKINNTTKLVLENNLKTKTVVKLLEDNGIYYFKGELIKKILLPETLKYINKLQKKELLKREVTILVNDNNKLNNWVIKYIAQNSKITKIVSNKIYKFKELENELYENHGIAVQFSNSYQKSLAKSDIIINLDFTQFELNEYVINNKAIIINCSDRVIKAISKFFNGIIINSYRIKFPKEINNIFENSKLLNEYENIILYESIINWHNINCAEIREKIDKDKIIISKLIGINGAINKIEFR